MNVSSASISVFFLSHLLQLDLLSTDFPIYNPMAESAQFSEAELLQALLDNCFGDITTPETPESRRGRFRKELQTVGSALFGLLLRSNSRQLRRLEKAAPRV